ncbi:MAG: flagellar biosynthesis anti-sigma factor FlgM [Steroidobacteraceae bacterium]
MPHNINGFESRPVQVGTGSVQRKGNDAATDATAGTKIAGADPVQITGSAKQLAALEQALKDQPVIDEARVAALRSAIDGGTYKVDATRVADKLLRMEDQLSSVLPK